MKRNKTLELFQRAAVWCEAAEQQGDNSPPSRTGEGGLMNGGEDGQKVGGVSVRNCGSLFRELPLKSRCFIEHREVQSVSFARTKVVTRVILVF